MGWRWRRSPNTERFRALAQADRALQRSAVRGGEGEHRESQPDWGALLEYVKSEGKKDARAAL